MLVLVIVWSRRLSGAGLSVPDERCGADGGPFQELAAIDRIVSVRGIHAALCLRYRRCHDSPRSTRSRT
jgi:hypothetical protein